MLINSKICFSYNNPIQIVSRQIQDILCNMYFYMYDFVVCILKLNIGLIYIDTLELVLCKRNEYIVNILAVMRVRSLRSEAWNSSEDLRDWKQSSANGCGHSCFRLHKRWHYSHNQLLIVSVENKYCSSINVCTT